MGGQWMVLVGPLAKLGNGYMGFIIEHTLLVWMLGISHNKTFKNLFLCFGMLKKSCDLIFF